MQAQGLTVQKKSTSMLEIVSLFSPDDRYDSLYLSNYATINLVNELERVPGVGNVTVLGVGTYSMRIWLDPKKLYTFGLSPGDVINAVQSQSQPVTAGQAGTPPADKDQSFQYTVDIQGQLDDAGAVRQHRRQGRERQRRPHRAAEGRGEGRARRPDLRHGLQCRRQACRRHCDLPDARGERARRRRPRSRRRWRS